MSHIDMSNPTVQRNVLINKMQEGKGKFFIRKEVLIFKDEYGFESIPPKSVAEDILKMQGLEISEEEVVVEKVEKPKAEKKSTRKPRKEKGQPTEEAQAEPVE